jgi:hypothetical protein
MTLPDSAFFELMRSVLGSIKTPFNKQTMLEDLSSFISRPEILKNIEDLINDEDRRIVAAIALLGEPAPGEMESFFTGEYSYAELQGILLNLEERLIIYRFREEGLSRIALNPKLENILAPIAENRGILFPVLSEAADAAKPSPMNPRLLAALFAFFQRGDSFFKTEAGNEPGTSFKAVFKKKFLDEGNRIFPGLAHSTSGDTSALETIAGGLVVLGLFIRGGETLKADGQRIAAFKDLDDPGRFEYLAAGIALYLHVQHLPEGSYISRSLIKNLVSLIHSLMDSLDSTAGLPEATIYKLIEILRREESGIGPLNAEGFGSWGVMGELPSSQAILEGLELSGLLVRWGTLSQALRSTAAGGPRTKKTEQPLIAMDSPFSCILYEEIPFADALDLAGFSDVEETGTTVRFTLSRESVVRGFDRSVEAEFMWQLLERLSQGRAGESLKWNLEDWEKRYKEVSLYQGLVLSLSGDRAYLAETEPLASMISSTLAPGIYLLSTGRDEAAAALRAAGVDILARPQGKVREINSSPFPPVPKSRYASASIPGSGEKTAKESIAREKAAEEIKQGFRAMLEKMNFSKQEREELEARVERRMIVSPSQLSNANLRYEKLEARSLDYVGKTSVAKQAISSGSVLEVNWTSPSGQEKILGKPEALEKRGGEMILILRLRNQEELLRIPLGKISLLKRIKQSIFGE